MNEAAANEILNARESIANAAVENDCARRPELLEGHGYSGSQRYVEETRNHLAYLAEAIRFQRPSIFIDYLAWVNVVLTSRGVPTSELIENLRCLRNTLASTVSAHVSKVACDYIECGFSHLRSAVPSNSDLDCHPKSELGRQYLRVLLRGEHRLATQLVLNASKCGLDLREIYLRVFQYSQREVGRLWETNKIGIGDEHYCSAATQVAIALVGARASFAPRVGHTLMSTCVEGELHDIGIRMVADFFEMEGWDTRHLGANAPTADLIRMLSQRKPSVLAISATMSLHLNAVANLIARIRDSGASPGTVIMVGGHGFGRVAGLWKEIGADAYAADASEAIATANLAVTSSQSS